MPALNLISPIPQSGTAPRCQRALPESNNGSDDPQQQFDAVMDRLLGRSSHTAPNSDGARNENRPMQSRPQGQFMHRGPARKVDFKNAQETETGSFGENAAAQPALILPAEINISIPLAGEPVFPPELSTIPLPALEGSQIVAGPLTPPVCNVANPPVPQSQTGTSQQPAVSPAPTAPSRPSLQERGQPAARLRNPQPAPPASTGSQISRSTELSPAPVVPEASVQTTATAIDERPEARPTPSTQAKPSLQTSEKSNGADVEPRQQPARPAGEAPSVGTNSTAGEKINLPPSSTSSTGVSPSPVSSGGVQKVPLNDPARGMATAEPSAAEIAIESNPPAPRSANGESDLQADGISTAKLDTPMKKALKTKEFTGQAEQKLPTTTEPAAREELPARAARFLKVTPSQIRPDFSTAAITPTPIRVTATTETQEAAQIFVPLAGSLRSVERAHDLVGLHAMRLRDSGGDSLQVVIKPGSGLQLSVSLHQGENGIEVRAQLDKGDFAFFKSHWGELQQELEQRGVRVAPLVHQTHPGGNGANGSERSNHRQPDDETAPAGASRKAGLVRGGQPAAARASSPPATRRGWETWA